eukprot:707929-Hanusia_phi.AAC.1
MAYTNWHQEVAASASRHRVPIPATATLRGENERPGTGVPGNDKGLFYFRHSPRDRTAVEQQCSLRGGRMAVVRDGQVFRASDSELPAPDSER